MNDPHESMTDLLEHTAERIEVRPAPVAAILERHRRRRTRLVVLRIVGATAAVVVGASGLVWYAGSPPEDRGRRLATDTTAIPLPASLGALVTLTPQATPFATATASGVPTLPDAVYTFAPRTLVGTWKVTALVGDDGGSVLQGPLRRKVWLSFRNDGTVVGDNGLNDVSGRFALHGDDLAFADLTVSLVGCVGCHEPPLEGRMELVRHVSRVGDTVYLHAENWMILIALRPVPDGSASPR